MEKIIKLKTPLDGSVLQSLSSGDIVELTGTILTARDAAHKRLIDAAAKGEALPVDLTNSIIFYAGPCPAKPGHVIGSIAPTTSIRMDCFVEVMFKLGMRSMIGKGERGDLVPPLCKKYGGVYFLSYGGASAIISNNVKKSTVIAYDDLGSESIKQLEVRNMRLVVGIDTKGNVFQTGQIALYKRLIGGCTPVCFFYGV